jgi:hypothetical protein
MFIYMGRLISEGGRFGHELVDNKFPTVGLITSVPWRWFGANWPAYVLLGAAMSVVTTAMLARTARRHIGSHATLPALLFAIVYLNFNFAVFGGFQLETIQAFFTVLAAGAAIEALCIGDWRDSFTAGLCAGVAAMLKPTGIAVIAAAIIAGALSRKRRENARLLVGFVVGLSIPALATLGYLFQTDTLRDMPALWRQIARYAANSSWDPVDWTKPVTILVLGGFPILVRGVIFRRESDRIDSKTDRRIVTFIIAWAILEAAGIAMQRRMYAYHFLVLVPPVTLLFAMLPRRVRAAPLAASLVPTALFSIYGASLVFEICYTGRTKLDVSEYVAAHAKPTDAVWKDDAARLWLETGCRPASAFPMTFLFANYDEAPIEYVTRILADFERTRPTYVVLPAQRQRWVNHQCRYILELSRFPVRRANFECAWQRIFAYVDANYQCETRIGNDAVYRKRIGGDARVDAR